MNPALLSESPTVATLNARAELRRLRMLVSGNPDAAAELDRLEDVLSEALCVADDPPGYVSQSVVDEEYVSLESYEKIENERDDLSEERDELQRELDTAEGERDEALDALQDSEDEVRRDLGDALRRISILEANGKALADKLARTEKERDSLKDSSGIDAMAQRVRDALVACNPGRRSKPKREQHDTMCAAIRRALEVQP